MFYLMTRLINPHEGELSGLLDLAMYNAIRGRKVSESRTVEARSTDFVRNCLPSEPITTMSR
jgi:hypothetical protein